MSNTEDSFPKLVILEAENLYLKEKLEEAERKYKAALQINIDLRMAVLDLTEQLERTCKLLLTTLAFLQTMQ